MLSALDHFQQISKIPRCSKQEEKITAFLKQWAMKHDFSCKTDKAGNLLITSPASTGQEKSPTIVLQCHMDMVCEKTPNCQHDFSKDPIQLIDEGDWLTAKDTTLGADNGAGLALAMAMAEGRSLIRPQLELLFTVDEESGLTGASSLESDFFTGRILINLDSEDEGVFTIGCAGGRDTECQLPIEFEPWNQEGETIHGLKVEGLQGGHSGINIGEQRANANSLLIRLLAQLNKTIQIKLIQINGGSAHNAIPRDAQAIFVVSDSQQNALKECVVAQAAELSEQYSNEPELSVSLFMQQEGPKHVFSKPSFENMLDLLITLPDGALTYSKEVPGLVETSVNLAIIHQYNKHLQIIMSQRSSRPASIEWLTERITTLCRLTGSQCQNIGGYPGWQPDMNSQLLSRASKVYHRLFNTTPKIEVIHAGLECGIIGSLYQGIDMISIGPTIKNPHSPDERLHLPSLQKVQQFLGELLSSYCDDS